jgi:hypothetical protein
MAFLLMASGLARGRAHPLPGLPGQAPRLRGAFFVRPGQWPLGWQRPHAGPALLQRAGGAMGREVILSFLRTPV